VKKLFKRWQQTTVQQALKIWRVVVISGPRQSGKTTLAQHVIRKQDTFITLDDQLMLNAALDDPMGFVYHEHGTLIIDEIQKAPSLLLAIKRTVDSSNRKGQFLLTGSADIRTLPTITDSLAGRISHVNLRTLANGEILGKRPTFLERAFQKDWPLQISGCDKKTVISTAIRGGYPEIVNLPERSKRNWHLDYAKSLMTRDLRDIANIQRKGIMENLLCILGAWSSKLMDVNAICGKLNIARNTFDRYVNALISLRLFEKLSPWTRTDYERVGRRDKIFATDTGLMSTLLGWNAKDAFMDSDKAGKLVETLAFNELIAQIDLGYEYSIKHYRDREGREIDFIVENGEGAILGIEIKAGSVVSKDDFRHMLWFKHNIVPDKEFIGIVLYTGGSVLPFGTDLRAVPFAALWI
jgi:predicted AAA+ superfamily ATPase